jgi:hypothetical protein
MQEKGEEPKSALPWRAVNWRAESEAGKSGRFLHQVIIRNQAKLRKENCVNHDLRPLVWVFWTKALT